MDITKIKIETGIPVPPPKHLGGVWVEFALKLKAGNSFVVPRSRASCASSIRNYLLPRGLTVVTRTIDKERVRVFVRPEEKKK